MAMVTNFIRFTETLKTKEDMRVVSITVRPLIADSTGTIWFTDLQMQEGDQLTGYTPHTTTMLRNSPNPPRYHNGVVRTGDTIIIFNLGETSAGLDCYIYPIQDMTAESVALSQGAGSHKMRFLASANAGDELVLRASTRECLKNGSATPKHGFFQYSAAHDSKHQVQLQERKSARVYFEYREMMKGQDRP
jgi:hypothetical protein